MRDPTGELGLGRAPLAGRFAVVFDCPMRDLDPSQCGEADRREVDPPIKVESARGPPVARSTGGWKSVSSGWGEYAGVTVVRSGLKLLIFVRRKTAAKPPYETL